MNICVFGDSTAWGAWDLEKGGWVNRLWLDFSKDYLDKEVDCFYNLSISGGTTETVLARLESESKIRDAEMIIIESGGNDSGYISEPNNFQVSPEKFENNIIKIIKLSKRITDKVIFMGFENIDEIKTMPVPWEKTLYYTNKNIKKYNDMMKNVCKNNKTHFIDVYGILDKTDLPDGIHPNASGHEKIAQRVKEYLLENKIVKV